MPLHRKIRTVLYALLASLILLAATTIADAQSTIPVSGTKVVDNNVLPLTGKIVMTVTDTSDNPVTYTVQGGSPSTATITLTVVTGGVPNVAGFPQTIPNPATMTPANTRYRVQATNTAGSTIYYTVPLVNVTTATWPADTIQVSASTTATGIGRPRLACAPGSQYAELDITLPHNWVCSVLKTDQSIVWTQNPSATPFSCPATANAYASPMTTAPFCTDSLTAYGTQQLILATPTVGTGPFSVVPQDVVVGPTGPAGPAGPTGNCNSVGMGVCIVGSPTAAQLITQANGTSFGTATTNCPTCNNFTNLSDGAPVGGGPDSSFTQNLGITQTTYGPWKNNANPSGAVNEAPGWDEGWTVANTINIQTNYYQGGISGVIQGNWNKESSGDFNGIYFYPRCDGGNVDASGEGCSIFKINGTESFGRYSGVVVSTSGTGDQAPVISDGGTQTGGFMVDTSAAGLTAFGTLNGQGAIWNDGSVNTFLYDVAVTPDASTPIVTSTGICKTTAYMYGAPIDRVPVSRTVTCQVVGGKTMTTGLAWQASPALPERVQITAVTAPSGGIQTLTVTGREPALFAENVASLAIATPGSGQSPGTYVVNATGGTDGFGAQASIVVNSGGTVTATPTIINPGQSYTTAPNFILAAGGTPATFTPTMNPTTQTYFIQGGTQGFMQYDADLSTFGFLSTYPVYGALDSTHVFFNFVELGTTYGANYPNPGTTAEMPTSGFHIWNGCRVMTLPQNGDANGLTCEVNDVAFTVGDTVQIPHSVAHAEGVMSLWDTQVSPTNPSTRSAGFQLVLAAEGGNSLAYNGPGYVPMSVINNNPKSVYTCTGCGGPLDAMNMFNITGTFSGIFRMDQPVNAMNGFGSGCSLGTVLCINNDHTQSFNLYAEYNSGDSIRIDNIDGPNPFVSFLGFGGKFGFNIDAASYTVAGAATSGQYMRGNGTDMVLSPILIGDLPGSVLTTGSAAAPALTSAAGGAFQLPAFTGGGVSKTCTVLPTVVNGIITGC